ncbi:uncharacterized protein EAE97_005509 [Botrytis byssoidea]|uniref:Uncharacterized protein n=1 Tax=Botrytis byssoidea TaxID=139641 RepID=A0A9P5IS32_9HELO|nr:uncharacterized protein EAE97_005509 [Botrytis byssoidea]KAF7944876.1 hypothetical protein EAE97_005509 [Botrytis byssoidea]
MEQHSGTNSFGKRNNDDPPRREEYMLRPQREAWEASQASRRDSHAYPSRQFRKPQGRKVDRYRPNYGPNNTFSPRVPRRNYAARQPSRLDPGTRETTTQRSENTRFDTARTSLSSAAGSADTSQEFESAPMISHPVEAAPPAEREAPRSRAEDEHELLSEHAGGPIRRFTKHMCDVITESITESSDDEYLSAIEILNRACVDVGIKTGTALGVHDCWMYWRKKVMQSNIALLWPESIDDVDEEVRKYRQFKNTKSDSTRAAYVARLATTPVIAESSATAETTETVAAPEPARAPTYWTREEQNFLFNLVKERQNQQSPMGATTFWISIGLAMRKRGHTKKFAEYREWFEKHGHTHLNHDETVHISRPRHRRAGAGGMRVGVLTPEDSPVDDTRRRGRGGSRLNSGGMRSRVSLAQRSPRIPKTPRPLKPRMASVVLHDAKSLARGYRNQDRTAKTAEKYPLQLITPSTGERFGPFTTEPRRAYDPPPSPAASPPGSSLFETGDEPQIERDLVPSDQNSTTSRLSPTPALTDDQSVMPDETTTPEGAVESGETLTSDEGTYSGEPTTPDERIGSGETMPKEVNDTPSLQPNETEDAEDDVRWTGDLWDFATPPTMRPSGADEMAQIDNQIEFDSSHISASTDSSDASTFIAPPTFDDSLTSNETIKEIPLTQPVSTNDIESGNNDSSETEAQLLREQQERTNLEIANLRANYLRVQEAREDDRKKLDDTAQELDVIVLRRAEQLESQTAHLAEMQRIEAELEEKIKAKQDLSNALEELEFYG